MGRTARDVEAYLLAIGRRYDTAEDGTIIVDPAAEGLPPIYIRAGDPVVFTADIGQVPKDDSEKQAVMFRRMLEHNASDLLYCAYGLRGEMIVLSAAQPIENLDLNELQAVISDIELALLAQVGELLKLSRAPASTRAPTTVLSLGSPRFSRRDLLDFTGTSRRQPRSPMGVFARLAQLIKANLNDLISRSEDPAKMLEQVILDMNSQLIQVKKQVALAIADLKQLEKQAEQEAANAAEWERRAMLAVRKGNDALATEALNRKREHDELAKQYQEQWLKQKAAVDKLKSALQVLNDKIEEAKRRKTLLIARQKRAEAQRAISETMSGLKDQSAFDTFARLEDKISRMEAEAEAGSELAEEYSGDNLAQQFRELERTAGASDDLSALKRKMGLLPAEPEAPAAPAQLRVPDAPTPPPAVAAPARAASALTPDEQDELAAALAEIEAEEQRQKQRMSR